MTRISKMIDFKSVVYGLIRYAAVPLTFVRDQSFFAVMLEHDDGSSERIGWITNDELRFLHGQGLTLTIANEGL